MYFLITGSPATLPHPPVTGRHHVRVYVSSQAAYKWSPRLLLVISGFDSLSSHSLHCDNFKFHCAIFILQLQRGDTALSLTGGRLTRKSGCTLHWILILYKCTTAAHGHEVMTHTVKPNKSWKHAQEVIRGQLVLYKRSGEKLIVPKTTEG